MQLDVKKQLAKNLAGIDKDTVEEISTDMANYFARVFRPPNNPD